VRIDWTDRTDKVAAYHINCWGHHGVDQVQGMRSRDFQIGEGVPELWRSHQAHGARDKLVAVFFAFVLLSWIVGSCQSYNDAAKRVEERKAASTPAAPATSQLLSRPPATRRTTNS